MDCALPGMSGLQATRKIVDTCPETVVLMLSMHSEDTWVRQALDAGARGYMQVMPFWTRLIGSSDHNLFNLRTNLRYGCVILRHYLDAEKGDLFRALGRYNGSLGRPEYPNAVLSTMSRWQYAPAAFQKVGAASSAIAAQ